MANGRPGRPKGLPKTGGRKPGSVSKHLGIVAEICARLHCDPFEGMAVIATNTMACGVCRGTGRSFYKLPEGLHAAGCDGKVSPKTHLCKCEGIGTRKCESCYETLYEACAPELRLKAYSDLASYIQAKRKAIEVSGPDGKPIEHDHTLKLVE